MSASAQLGDEPEQGHPWTQVSFPQPKYQPTMDTLAIWSLFPNYSISAYQRPSGPVRHETGQELNTLLLQPLTARDLALRPGASPFPSLASVYHLQNEQNHASWPKPCIYGPHSVLSLLL